MLPKPENRAIVGSLPGETHKAKFDPTAAAHLMDLLGKGIYTDPELAVLREYSCNARDSHDEAGNSAPIEIQLPSTLSPQLRIIDHGIGLTKDEVITFLTHYGASTKRVEGNTQTGSLGIGGKSGFAYGDQFNIIATKDGLQTIVSASRDEEGGAEFTFMDPIQTSEPNGVTIEIPAKRWNDFGPKATKFFQYWKRGTVLINDVEPEPITEQDNVEKITDKLYLTQQDYTSESVIVMCNVPYRIATSEFGIDIGYNRQILAFVDVDAVDFSGNRERLRMSAKTKATLQAIGQEFKDEYIKAMQTEIDACATPQEAIRCATKWYLASPEGMRPKSWTYNGKEIPKEFAIGEPNENGLRPRMVVVKRHSSKQKSHDKMQVIPFHTAINAIWFYGYDLEFTSGHRRRLDEWCNQQVAKDPNWKYPEIFILASKKVVSEYLDPTRIYDWEEVRSIKMPSRERSEHGRLLGSYDALLGSSDYARQILAEDVDDAEPVYYYVGDADNNSRWHSSRSQRALPYHVLLRTLEPNCTTLLIPATREAKLLRTFPEAKTVQSAAHGLFQEWYDGLTDDEKQVLYIAEHYSDDHGKLKALDENRIDDPEVYEAIVLVKNTDVRTRRNELANYQRVDHSAQITGSWNTPLARYPLYSTGWQVQDGSHTADHIYLYINAVYAQAQIEAAAAVEALVKDELAVAA